MLVTDELREECSKRKCPFSSYCLSDGAPFLLFLSSLCKKTTLQVFQRQGRRKGGGVAKDGHVRGGSEPNQRLPERTENKAVDM